MPFPVVTWPSGYQRDVLQSVDSTMNEATRRGCDLADPLWILAYEQTRGRGRQGKNWSDPKGNFSASLTYVLPTSELKAAPLRSFLAANALYDALLTVVPASDLALKWPNDVLLKGKKLAGILLEAQPCLDRVFTQLSIGFGVNLKTAPVQVQGAMFEPISLYQGGGVELSPDDLLETLAFYYAKYENEFVEHGFEGQRQMWMSRALRLGEIISVSVGGEILTGMFSMIDETGQLVLCVNGVPRHISAGDVWF